MNQSQFQESPREQDFTVVNVTVPTFRNENTLLQAAGISERAQADKLDAFLFYSNDDVRIRTLSDGIVGAEHRSTPTHVSTRKTRISFELHPSVFMEDLLLSDESFSDNEEELAKAMNEDPSLCSISELYANIRVPRAA